jgi:hypothetical protein
MGQFVTISGKASCSVCERRALSRERDSAPEGSEDRAFKSGRLLAFYEVLSMMQNRAESFGLALSALRLEDVDPDRDLT